MLTVSAVEHYIVIIYVLEHRYYHSEFKYHNNDNWWAFVKGVRPKNLEATLLFIDFLKVLDFILAYGLPKEAATTIVMLYKTPKAMDCLPDGDTNFFHIVAGVLQGDKFAPYFSYSSYTT